MITNLDPSYHSTFDYSAIIKTFGHSSKNNFAAAAVGLNRHGEAVHAGIIINFNESLSLFHYNGQMVLFEDVPLAWYFHKDFLFVDDFLVESFLAHCQMANETAHPKYGFVFPYSFYRDKVYFSEDNIPEYMTCVGFCLNVIQGFLLDEKFIDYEGWDIDSIKKEGWAIEFIEKFRINNPQFSEDDIKKYLKRVSPDEYLAASFFNKMPIEKSQIDIIIDDVRSVLKDKIII